MDAIDRLSALFERFPGIGPRQARRFVQFLLRASPTTRKELVESVQQLSRSAHQCSSCMRFHSDDKKICLFCSSPSRDNALLAVVASDTDLDALERSGTYKGRYFVLGGTISLASEKAHSVCEKELLSSLAGRVKAGLKEVILALPANPEGDYTAHHIRDSLASYANDDGFKITMLGRGLSTGSELEYADPDTIKSALEGRR